MLIYNFTQQYYYYKNWYELPNETIRTKNWFDVIFFARGHLPSYDNFIFSQVVNVTTTIGYEE